MKTRLNIKNILWVPDRIELSELFYLTQYVLASCPLSRKFKETVTIFLLLILKYIINNI